jgi:phosphopantothenoylcysteine decarboxylase / phosphopantothenate---cysteine ligase
VDLWAEGMDGMNPISSKRILLGVTGSIAAYKAADLASKLTQAGAEVDTILTPAALQFIDPLTFQSVTGRRAYIEADLWGAQGHIQHIGLANDADLVLIAPASANTIAKLAHGLADNLLTLTALASTCPLLIAPAMDGDMYAHPATQENLEKLVVRGAHLVGPLEGHLASGLSGKGRMAEPIQLLGEVRWLLARQGPLTGCKVLVTAGGTQEPLDPVRMIANRSSGKQGYALAQAALDQGADVTLISGPVALDSPVGARRINVRTAAEMLEAVLAELPESYALLMAAAVADFSPAKISAEKIKKGAAGIQVQLSRTKDILQEVASWREEHGWPKVVVGFAAESGDLLENARQKLQLKHLDMIVANDILAKNAGFSVDTNQVSLLFPDGRSEPLPLLTKMEVAEEVLRRVIAIQPRV